MPIILTATSIDWSATAAWIALAVAIISPVITTIISNNHQTKTMRLEIIEKRGLDVIENYLAVTSHEILTTGVSESYQKCYAQIFIYAPKSIHSDIEKLNRLITNTSTANLPFTANNGASMFPDRDACSQLLVQISKALSYDKM